MSDVGESRHTRDLDLFTLIREDYERHGRDWTRPGFRAMVVYRFGVCRMRIRTRLLRAPLSFLYRRLFIRVRNRYGIEIPFTAQLGRRVTLEHSHAIVIHGNSVIGNDCYIRQGCTLGNKSLDAPFDAPSLGDRVNVGTGAKLLGKVIVGDDATIGANSVVVKDVPSGAVAMGVPARIVRKADLRPSAGNGVDAGSRSAQVLRPAEFTVDSSRPRAPGAPRRPSRLSSD
ncbi:MAG: serine acetyltransferase [Gammaproteobacteria bacterium]|nr:serine acetyltransferase [Gammaproteobacteria bacterium]